MPGLRHPDAQLPQALQVEVEGLARVGEGLGQGVAARDDLREVNEVNREDRFGRAVADRKDIPQVFVNGPLHNPSTPRSFRISWGWQVLRRPWGLTIVRTLPSG